MVAERADQWMKEAELPGRDLGYQSKKKQGDVVGLLKKPGIKAWTAFTVPTPMREVEPGVKLVMDDSKLENPPTWQHASLEQEDDS